MIYFLSVKFICQRMGCEAQEVVGVGVEDAYQAVESFTPDGWGWDRTKKGDLALHCSEHRG